MEFEQLYEEMNLATLESQDKENKEPAQKDTMRREMFIFSSFTLSSAAEYTL